MTVYELQAKAIKDSLENGKKNERDALLYIEELEQKVKELENKLNKPIREVNIVDENDVLVASIGPDDTILKNGYRVSNDETININ